MLGAIFLGACCGVVVNPVSSGHITSLDSPQNGHVTPCGTSFILLYGPETLNVFWHFVQVTIFSIHASHNRSTRVESGARFNSSGNERFGQPFRDFRSFAFRVRAFAAALEKSASWPPAITRGHQVHISKPLRRKRAIKQCRI